MGNKLMVVGIVVLAVIAVVLGYQIYQETLGPKTQPLSQTQPPTTPQTGGNQQNTQSTIPASTIPQEDWNKIVNFDETKADEEQTIDFSDAVVKYAKETNVIEFSQCKASPQIVTLKIGSELTIRSIDSKEQSLGFGSKQFPMNPGESLKVSVNFIQTPGIYRYACSYGVGNTGTYISVAGVLRATN